MYLYLDLAFVLSVYFFVSEILPGINYYGNNIEFALPCFVCAVEESRALVDI